MSKEQPNNPKTGKFLLVYLLNGQKLNVDIFNWNESQLNGNKPWIISDTIVEGYGDITSIVNWHSIGRSLEDYTFIRQEIKKHYEYIGAQLIGEDDAKILCSLFLLPKEQRDIYFTESEQQTQWNDFLNASMDCRKLRWTKAKNYAAYNLDSQASSDLAYDVLQLCENYINYNITSEVLCGKPGLYDYIQGTSVYENSGFPAKSYWSQELQDNIINILHNNL